MVKNTSVLERKIIYYYIIKKERILCWHCVVPLRIWSDIVHEWIIQECQRIYLPILSSLQLNKTYADELWDWENVRISHRISFFMSVLWVTNEHCNFCGWTDPPHANLCLNGMLEFTQQSLHLKWNKQPSTAILWWDRVESTNISLVYVRSQYKLCIQ